MAFEEHSHNFEIEFQSNHYDQNFSTLELSSSPFPQTGAMSSHRRDSIISSSSCLGSDMSLFSNEPATPTSQMSYGMSFDGFSSGPHLANKTYGGNSDFSALGQPGNFGQNGISFKSEPDQTTKPFSGPWSTPTPTFLDDTSLNIQIRYQNLEDTNSIPIAYSAYHLQPHMSNMAFTPLAAGSPLSTSWLNPLDTPISTVSPQQICAQSPMITSPLEAPFTTPSKKPRSGCQRAKTSTRRRQRPVKYEDDDTWSTTAQADARRYCMVTPPPSSNEEHDLSEATAKLEQVRLKGGRTLMIPADKLRKQRSGGNYCYVCPPNKEGKIKSFYRSEHLTRHNTSVHKTAGPSEFPCLYCEDVAKDKPPKIFNRHDNLKQHIINTHLKYREKGRSKRLVNDFGVPEMDLIEHYGFRRIYDDMLNARKRKEASSESFGGSARRSKTSNARHAKKTSTRRQGASSSNYQPILHALYE